MPSLSPPALRRRPARFARWAAVVALAAGAAGCGGDGPRLQMRQINRVYLDMREHIDTEDFSALEADGSRLGALVERIRPYNADAIYQQHADELAALATRMKAAGRARALEAARTTFLELNRPCAACHRVYRVRATID